MTRHVVKVHGQRQHSADRDSRRLYTRPIPIHQSLDYDFAVSAVILKVEYRILENVSQVKISNITEHKSQVSIFGLREGSSIRKHVLGALSYSSHTPRPVSKEDRSIRDGKKVCSWRNDLRPFVVTKVRFLVCVRRFS